MPIKLPGTWIALSSKSKVTDLQQTARSTSLMNAFLLLPLFRIAFVTALSVCTATVRPAHSGAHLATAEATAQTSFIIIVNMHSGHFGPIRVEDTVVPVSSPEAAAGRAASVS